jgi:RNA polymerase sigma factor (sigma-70 family)
MDRNREVFEEHYAMSLKEIGDVLGVSRQTVRTIEQSALRKIRKILSHNKWVDLQERERGKS